MAAGFFITMAAISIELFVLMVAMILVFIKIKAPKSAFGPGHWWPIGVVALASSAAVVFTAHYAPTPRDSSWMAFIALNIGIPLLLAVMLTVTVRKGLNAHPSD